MVELEPPLLSSVPSLRDTLKLGGLGVLAVAAGRLPRLPISSELHTDHATDLSAIFSKHLDPNVSEVNDGHHMWPKATQRLVESMKFEVLGLDSLIHNEYTDNLCDAMPLGNPNRYLVEEERTDPLYVVAADMHIRTYDHPDSLEQNIWTSLAHIDSTFGEVTAVGIEKNVNDRLTSVKNTESRSGEAGIAAAIATYVGLRTRLWMQENNGTDITISSKGKKLDWSLAFPIVLGALFESRPSLREEIAYQAQEKPLSRLGVIEAQLINTMLRPLSDAFSYISIRNARVALAVIDKSKRLFAQRAEIQKDVKPVRAGIVFGNAHLLGEYPAPHNVLGWREPVDLTEARLVHVLKDAASGIVADVQKKLPKVSADLVYVGLRNLFGEYSVYEIPQSKSEHQQGKYVMNDIAIPIASVDCMLRNLIEGAYHTELPPELS